MSKSQKVRPLTKQQTQLLKKTYYTEKNLFGRDKLFKLLQAEPNHPTKEQVGEWLKTQEVHQLHLKQKRSNALKPVIVKKPDSLFEIDLIDMGEHSDENRYILTMIDVFSRFAFAEALEDKEAKSVLMAFKKISKDVKITRLQSDNGSEFIDQGFKNYLASRNIKQFLTVPGKPQTNGVIERFNGTLKSMLQKDITATFDNNWSAKLQTYINNYNNSYHETIKMTPAQAKVNTGTAFKNVTDTATKHTGRKIIDIKVGDTVRRKKFKGKLEKHSTVNWTHKTYIVEKVIQPTKPYYSTTFKLEGIGHHYTRNDLQPITEIIKPSKKNRIIPEDEYEVENITEKKIVDGKTKYLVKWRGYDEPSWESHANVKDTQAYKTFTYQKNK